MRQERSFRGSDESSAFDWQRAARDLDVPLDVARALYLRATRVVDDPRRAEALYRRWLRDAAAARSAAQPLAPGRQTRVEHEARDRRYPRPRDAAAVSLGKWTRSLLETETEAEDSARSARLAHGARACKMRLPHVGSHGTMSARTEGPGPPA